MRRLLIDTDTASDDSVAIIMSLRNSFNIQVEALTIVAGNVELEKCVQNALYTLELCGRTDIPVYSGASKPIELELGQADFVHGEDGLGGVGLDLKGRIPAQGQAVDKIIELAYLYEGELELVMIGPHTNIALALKKDPSIAKKIKHCYIMGGTGRGMGNITPYAEFNIWVDPHAANIVFQSGMKMTLIGWDVTVQYANIFPNDMKEIEKIQTRYSNHFIQVIQGYIRFKKQYKEDFIELADPLAMSVVLNPEIILESEYLNLMVTESSNDYRGEIKTTPGDIQVVCHVKPTEFLKLLKESLN
jgi:purine nucleosidase